MVIRFCLLTFVIAVTAVSAPGQKIATSKFVCERAHAHNDYLHKRPLLDAVENGFCSVEADIFLIEGKLLVGHTVFQLRSDRTLQSLYLDPLKELARKNKGSVHGDQVQFTLLIDIKNNGVETYRMLDALLSEYSEIFNSVRYGVETKGPVVAIVSGDRPVNAIQADTTRFVGIDGRLSDLNSETPPDLMPLISDKWTNHFPWRGDGEISAAEKRKLTDIVRQVHAAGRRLRFWATPDRESVWKVLDDAGVDLINTDDLSGLSNYFQQSDSKRTNKEL